jgi:glycine C-acetyltransferase
MSIREGIRMSEAERVTYRHLDLNHLESGLKNSKAAIKIIVSDGVFSMDGDIAPLPDLVKLADLYDAIVYIDDAHGTGVLGATGGGISEHFNVYSPRMIHMGTLSKAYGAIGGFVATESYVSCLLRYASTAYGFTSTIPPDQAFAVSEAIDMVKDEPIRLKTLWKNQRYFVSEMEKRGFRLVSKETPIVPLLIGDEALCDVISFNLREQGFHIDRVKFPGVPKNKSRLRFILNAGHKTNQIDRLVAIMSELAERYPQVINAD